MSRLSRSLRALPLAPIPSPRVSGAERGIAVSESSSVTGDNRLPPYNL